MRTESTSFYLSCAHDARGSSPKMNRLQRARWSYLRARVQGLLGAGRRWNSDRRPQVAILVWGFPPLSGVGSIDPYLCGRWPPCSGPTHCWCCRPLLVHGEGGEVQCLVDSQRAGAIVAREDAVGLEAALSAIARGQLASPETSVEWLSAHTRETLAKRTWTLVEQMLPPDSRR